MKSILSITKDLNERRDFRVIETSFDGGSGIFIND